VVTILTKSILDEKLILKWYLSPETGKVIWKGPLVSGLLIADKPYPVLLVAAEGGQPELICFSFDGERKLWHKRPAGKILYAGSDPTEKVVFTVMTTDITTSQNVSQKIKFSCYSIETGRLLFETTLSDLFLSPATSNDIVTCSNGIAYFAFGGAAAAISMTSGKLLWKERLDTTIVRRGSPVNIWHAFDAGAVFVSDKYVHLFSDRKGMLWKTDIGPGVYLRTISLVDTGILLSYWLKRGVGVMLLDRRDGKILWKHNTMGKKEEVISPKGIVALKDTVLYSVDRKLIAVNLHDGTERFVSEVEVKSKVYADFGLLLERGGNAVLLGNWNVRAHDVTTGDVVWAITGFETPYVTWSRYMAFASSLQAGVMMASDTAFGTAYGRDVAGLYREYTFRRWSSDWNLNIPVVTRDTMIDKEISAAMGEKIPSLNRVGIGSAAKPGPMRGGMIPGRYVSFLNSKQKFVATTFEANLAVVDLETGATIFYQILSGGTQCSPYAFTDSSLKWVIQTYEPVGFFCKKQRGIDVLKIQPPE
jgi:outer membrane protein assembly factor BamB